MFQDYPKHIVDVLADVPHFCFAEECLEETLLELHICILVFIDLRKQNKGENLHLQYENNSRK